MNIDTIYTILLAILIPISVSFIVAGLMIFVDHVKAMKELDKRHSR